MKTDYFYWLLNMTVAGTVTGLVLLALRQVRAIPRRVIYLMWLIPAFRFAAPVSFSFRFSIMNLFLHFGGRTVPIYGSEEEFLFFTAANYHQAADFVMPVAGYRTKWLEQIFLTASWVWLAGVFLLLTVVLWSWWRSGKEKGSLAEDGMYRSETVTGPVVMGIFRPRIVLPADWPAEGSEYALIHERVHLRRRDNLFRLLAVLLACAHWFNPFAWKALKWFLEDLELSCDESVIRKLDQTQRQEYAKALLSQAEVKGAAGNRLLASAFGGAGLKGRLERILTYRRLSGAAWCAVCLLLVFTAVVMAANPA